MEAIKVHNLYKSYGDVKVVKDASLTVKKGEVFGLLGANGAGKSTTIECILGTKNFDYGQVSTLDMNPQKERKQLFQKVGFSFNLKKQGLTIFLTSHFMDKLFRSIYISNGINVQHWIYGGGE